MKHFLTLLLALCIIGLTTQAQTKPAPKKPAPKKATAAAKKSASTKKAVAKKDTAHTAPASGGGAGTSQVNQGKKRNVSDNAPDLNKITKEANADTSHHAAEGMVTTPESNPNQGKPTMKLFGKTIELPSGNNAPVLNSNPK